MVCESFFLLSPCIVCCFAPQYRVVVSLALAHADAVGRPSYSEMYNGYVYMSFNQYAANVHTHNLHKN